MTWCDEASISSMCAHQPSLFVTRSSCSQADSTWPNYILSALLFSVNTSKQKKQVLNKFATRYQSFNKVCRWFSVHSICSEYVYYFLHQFYNPYPLCSTIKQGIIWIRAIFSLIHRLSTSFFIHWTMDNLEAVNYLKLASYNWHCLAKATRSSQITTCFMIFLGRVGCSEI